MSMECVVDVWRIVYAGSIFSIYQHTTYLNMSISKWQCLQVQPLFGHTSCLFVGSKLLAHTRWYKSNSQKPINGCVFVWKKSTCSSPLMSKSSNSSTKWCQLKYRIYLNVAVDCKHAIIHVNGRTLWPNYASHAWGNIDDANKSTCMRNVYRCTTNLS